MSALSNGILLIMRDFVISQKSEKWKQFVGNFLIDEVLNLRNII